MRTRTSRRPPVPFLLLSLAACSLAPGLAARAAADELSAELQPIEYRLGLWTAAVEWLDADGTVSRVVPSVREVRAVLGGHGLLERGRLVGTDTEVVAIVFVDERSGGITEAGVSAPGYFDLLHATLEEERVIFTAEPRRRGEETVIFRAIDSDFEEDRYRTTGWVSTDGGETWRQTFRQTNVRLHLFDH